MPLAPLRLLSSRSHGVGELSRGSYLTDGRRLLRVISRFAADEHRFASLEDCLTLEVHAYTPGELDAMKLRPVRAGQGR